MKEEFGLLGTGSDFVMPPSLCRAAMGREDPQARRVTVGQEDSR